VLAGPDPLGEPPPSQAQGPDEKGEKENRRAQGTMPGTRIGHC
jgi:hypothetical protein